MPQTTSILAVLSMLHESTEACSTSRLFRGDPVLAWTLRRLQACQALGGVVVLCWMDQEEAAAAIAVQRGGQVISAGARVELPQVQAISAARRWADGWRGGPQGTSSFDPGFHGPSILAAIAQYETSDAKVDAIVLVDPSSGLIDSVLVDSVIHQWQANRDQPFAFVPAATGLGCMLLAKSTLEMLSAGQTHPGRLLHYFPDQLSREPLAGTGCASAPTPVLRSNDRFTLGSRRQIDRLAEALEPLNGELIGSRAEVIVTRAALTRDRSPLPREVVLELTVRRLTRPIYSPLSTRSFDRGDLPLSVALKVIDELAELDESRLTLAGVGDPLLHADLLKVIDHATSAGIAVNVETDLLTDDLGRIDELARSAADIVTVHLPALSAAVYGQIMQVDRYHDALVNLQRFVTERQSSGRGTPLVVPLFTKCRQNLHEMEPWYDQWLRAVGTAAIVGPTQFGGLVPDVAAAGMSPPRRVPCRRLRERLTLLSDGCFTTCEQDVLGRQVFAKDGEESLREVWQNRMAMFAKAHADGRWNESPVCAACQEWHRP